MDKKIEFKVRFITPLLIHGADPREVDEIGLTGKALRGCWRFWFRAIVGGLYPNISLSDLYKAEGEIFGSSDENVGAKFRMSIKPSDELKKFYSDNIYPGFNRRFSFKGFNAGCEFEITIRPKRKNMSDEEQKILIATIWLWATLGAVGQRARRGFGAPVIISGNCFSQYGFLIKSTFDKVNKLKKHLKNEVNKVKNVFNSWYKLRSLTISTTGKTAPPFFTVDINKISVGDKSVGEDIKSAITAVHGSSKCRELGDYNPRRASPVFTRLYKVNNEFYAVVTWTEPKNTGCAKDYIKNNCKCKHFLDRNFLVNVSIGPVQEFIKEARKTKDLWVGSKLLSRITYQALTPFIKNNCLIIYPSLAGFNKTGSLPNHFIVKVSADNFNTLIQSSQNAVKVYWQKITDGVKEIIKSEFNNTDNFDNLWNEQVGKFWEYIWVAISVSDAELENDYKAKADEIQKFLEERKLTRIFKQWQGDNREKCTQCGHREVLGPSGMRANRDFWKNIRSDEEFMGKLKKAERLCAICTIKRFITADMLNHNLSPPVYQEPDFESTSDISVIPFKQAVENLGNSLINGYIGKYNDLMKALNPRQKDIANIKEVEGAFLYEDELRPKELVKEYFPDLYLDKNKKGEFEKKIEEIEPVANELREKLEKLLNGSAIKPTKYYTILAMDGDEIGKWLFDVKTITEHNQKSSQLGEMAKFMEDTIANWSGKSIYAGGDDLLAFGPMEKSLSTSIELYRTFWKKIGKTISASLVITHYSNPLRRDIELARKYLEDAKELYGRDAFVLTIHLASGALITFKYKWRIPVKESYWSVFRVISKMVKMINAKKLNIGFIFDLMREIPAFYNQIATRNLIFNDEIFKTIALRYYKRHRPGFSKLNKAEQIEDLDKIKKLLDLLGCIANPDRINDYAFFRTVDFEENFRNLLRVIAFLVREEVREV